MNVCPRVSTELSDLIGVPCEKFISGSTVQGLHTVIVRYEENLRKVLASYQKSNRSSTAVR